VRDAEPVVSKDENRHGNTMFEAMFPKRIAEALKAGQKVEPEQHDLVTGTNHCVCAPVRSKSHT